MVKGEKLKKLVRFFKQAKGPDVTLFKIRVLFMKNYTINQITTRLL